MEKILSLFAVMAFTFVSNIALASQDVYVEIEENGDLVLPEKYQPANFDVENKSITIKNTTLNMPFCMAKYFKNPETYKLKITSSWHRRTHPSDILPTYINFSVKPKGESYDIGFLFNLNNLELISADKTSFEGKVCNDPIEDFPPEEYEVFDMQKAREQAKNVVLDLNIENGCLYKWEAFELGDICLQEIEKAYIKK